MGIFSRWVEDFNEWCDYKQPVEVKDKPKGAMRPSQQRVFNRLVNSGETSVYDYPRGFRLGARIGELRDLGINIITVPYDPINLDNRLCKYVLIV